MSSMREKNSKEMTPNKELFNKSTFVELNFRKAMIAAWGKSDSQDEEPQPSKETINLCSMAKLGEETLEELKSTNFTFSNQESLTS